MQGTVNQTITNIIKSVLNIAPTCLFIIIIIIIIISAEWGPTVTVEGFQ